MGGLQNGLANLIARLDSIAFEHVIGAMRPVADEDVQPLCDSATRVLCIGKPGSKVQIGALATAIRTVRPDVVHSRNWAAIEAIFAARATNVAGIIHSEHGLDHNTAVHEPRSRRIIRRIGFELADVVVSVSDVLRHIHAKRTGFSRDRIHVIHNGVDTQRFAPNPSSRTAMRNQLGFRPDEFCIGCIGNLTPVKDHMTLLRALAKGSGPTEFRVVFAGAGPEQTRLTEFTAAHPVLRDRVMFLGRMHLVPELLNALDVYVLPSLTEGICNALLEAMATGLPCVATRTGGNPEIVEHGVSGLLFPVADVVELASCLLQVQLRHEVRERMGRGALLRARSEFSLEAMVANYNRIYRTVLEAKRGVSHLDAAVKQIAS
jgi:sugar transferase (PEP-CTERM/EpsH1 system associated)